MGRAGLGFDAVLARPSGAGEHRYQPANHAEGPLATSGTDIPDPAFVALSGSTLYGTDPGDCDGETADERSDGSVVAIDTVTGTRSKVAELDCGAPAGVAVAPDGTLPIAMRTEIIRLNPADGSKTTVSKGGVLRDARDIALTSSGDLIVADATPAAIDGRRAMRVNEDGR